MLEPAVDAGGPVDNDFDDIERELSCSTREVGVGYVPFDDPDKALAVPTPSDVNRITRPWGARSRA